MILRWVGGALLAWMITGANLAAAAGVAIVTDIVGTAFVIEGESRTHVDILTELEDGAQVRLGEGARLVTLMVSTGAEYAFTGPGRIAFAPAAPRVTEGTSPVVTPAPLGHHSKLRIRTAGARQAGFVMRGLRRPEIVLQRPRPGVLLDATPIFSWLPVAGMGTYWLEISDADGKVIYRAKTRRSELQLPDDARLRAGAHYAWSITSRASDGRELRAAGKLDVASAELRAEVEQLRPAAGAPVAARVAFAAWLEERSMMDEAHAYWVDISRDRPQAATVRARASGSP